MLDEKDKSESSTDTADENAENKSHEPEDDETDGEEDSQDEAKPKEDSPKEGKSDDSEYYKSQADKYKKLYEDRTEALKRVSKAKKAEEHADDSEGENEPSSAIPDVVKKELDEFKKDQSLQLFDDVLGTIAETPAEREALEYIYKSRIQPSGFTRKALLSDLADAKLILDKDKFSREAEAKAEARVKKNIAEDKAMKNVGGGASGRKPPESRENYSAEERSYLSAIADYKKRNNIK